MIRATYLTIIFLLAVLRIQSQSLEGNMTGKLSGHDMQLFVWFDLEISSENGGIMGSYFYKNMGKEITLSEKKLDNRISLTEKDKNLQTTGTFNLEMMEGCLIGY